MNLELKLGHTMSGLPVVLNNLENPHISISGRSGSGKSYFLRKLIAQAVHQGALCAIFDYSSDFCEDAVLEDIPVQRVDVTSPVFTLNPLVGQNPNLCAQQLLALLHALFRMGSRATMALRSATTEYLASGGTPSIDGLLEFTSNLEKIGPGLAAALDPLSLLASLVHSGDKPISLDLTSPGLVVLDFSQIIDPDLKKFLVELVLQAIWTQRTAQQLVDIPPIVLILDECQSLSWTPSSMSIRILREGRKYDIGGWFASQWVSNKEAIAALGQAAFQANFRPDNQNVRQLAKRLCPSGGPDLADYQRLVQSLQRGQFLYQNPFGKITKVCVTA